MSLDDQTWSRNDTLNLLFYQVMAELGLATKKPQEKEDGSYRNVVENSLEENVKQSDNIGKISTEDDKQENNGQEENDKQKNSYKIILEENHCKEPKLRGIEVEEKISLSANTKSLECPTIPGSEIILINHVSNFWQIHKFMKISIFYLKMYNSNSLLQIKIGHLTINSMYQKCLKVLLMSYMFEISFF